MATLNSVPDQQTINVFCFRTKVETTPTQFKLVPKNYDGSIMDCTGFIMGSFYARRDTTDPLFGVCNLSATLDTADATGVLMHLDADQESVITALGDIVANYAVYMVDGSQNDVCVGFGNLQFIMLP